VASEAEDRHDRSLHGAEDQKARCYAVSMPCPLQGGGEGWLIYFQRRQLRAKKLHLELEIY
jgi:hypothetical protein